MGMCGQMVSDAGFLVWTNWKLDDHRCIFAFVFQYDFTWFVVCLFIVSIFQCVKVPYPSSMRSEPSIGGIWETFGGCPPRVVRKVGFFGDKIFRLTQIYVSAKFSSSSFRLKRSKRKVKRLLYLREYSLLSKSPSPEYVFRDVSIAPPFKTCIFTPRSVRLKLKAQGDSALPSSLIGFTQHVWFAH